MLDLTHLREIIENEIAERFDLGRHIVRSVLADLERMGLVERRPNRGVVVIEYGSDEIEALYEMREIVQREAVMRIALPVQRATLATRHRATLRRRMRAAADRYRLRFYI